MIFTEALKKEVFGHTAKGLLVTNAIVVERSAVPARKPKGTTALKPAITDANPRENRKANS